ncbi:MAG: HupE/UreJ family protein [Deltaproteobacteria bacterium]|nr:HupE/UreJ family protein [Deltaproteobacteria bacterium]
MTGLMRARFALTVLLFAAAMMLAAPASAHFYSVTEMWNYLDENGSFRVDIIVDIKALMVGMLQTDMTDEELDRIIDAMPEEDRKARREHVLTVFPELVVVKFDGRPVEATVDVVHMTKDDVGWWSQVSLPEETMRLTGRVPRGARKMSILASEIFGTVNHTFREAGRDAAMTRSVYPGMESEVYEIKMDTGLAPGTAPWKFAGRGFLAAIVEQWTVVLVAAAFALSAARFGALAREIALFAVGLSVAVQWTAHGPVTLHAMIAGPLAGLTLLACAAGTWRGVTVSSYRAPAAALFGAFQGFALAQGAAGSSLPDTHRVFAAVVFNLGAAAAAAVIAALVFLIAGPLRAMPWYERRVVRFGAAVLALASLAQIVRSFLA